MLKTMKLTCKEATYLSAKGEDGRLGLYDRIKLLMHQLICPPCRRFAIQTKKIKDYFKQIKVADKPNLSDKLSEESKERIRKHIDENYK